ncbi:MAG: glycosyltransferase family 9 protein [Nitrospirota bacterium]
MNGKLIRFIDSYIGIPMIFLISIVLPARKKRTFRPADVPPKKILLIKFWGIGNLFMLLPAIQALRAAFPDSSVDFLTLAHNRDALTMTGAVDNAVTVDIRTLRTFLKTWFSVFFKLRRERYDMIIDFEQFARFSALLTHQIGATRTIGFTTRGQHRHRLYTDPVAYDNDIHMTRSFYALAEKSGITQTFTSSVTLHAREMLRSKGNGILKKHGIMPSSPAVVMHIGSSDNFKERRWPPAYYAELADLLTDRFGMHIIMTGLPDEISLIAEAKQHMKHSGRIIDLSGQLSFADYYALITVADLVISADTATVHIASAVNTPVVGLYGPNTPKLYGPWGKGGLALYAGFDCSPCITNFNDKISICRHPDGRGACMNAISVETAFKSIEKYYFLPDAPWLLNNLKASIA